MCSYGEPGWAKKKTQERDFLLLMETFIDNSCIHHCEYMFLCMVFQDMCYQCWPFLRWTPLLTSCILGWPPASSSPALDKRLRIWMECKPDCTETRKWWVTWTYLVLLTGDAKLKRRWLQVSTLRTSKMSTYVRWWSRNAAVCWQASGAGVSLSLVCYGYFHSRYAESVSSTNSIISHK